MADEVTSTPTVETTPATPSSVTSEKPYDMLDAYEAEAPAEAPPAKVDAKVEEAKEEKVEEAGETPKEEGAKSKEGDKVDDGFEQVPVTKTIDGKDVTFTVKDAIQAYVKQEEFNRNMDRRVTTISKREQAWKQDHDSFRSKVNEVIALTRKGDFITPIKALAKMAAGESGLDVVEFEKQYFNQLEKVREVYTKLTPEQREAYFAKRQAQEATARAKELEDEKTATVSKSELEGAVAKLQQDNGLTNEEFWTRYEFLKEQAVGEGKPFKTPDDITAEKVVEYALVVRHEEKVHEAGKKLGVADKDVLQQLSLITISDPTLTVEQIGEVLKASGLIVNAPKEAVENLNRKAGKSNTRFNQASSTKKASDIPEGYDQETLAHLYRNQPKVYRRPSR